MGQTESYFPLPVTPLDVSKDEDDKDQKSNEVNDNKDRNLINGSTSDIEEDLKIFEKYLKKAIVKELNENYNQNQRDISLVVKQAQVSSENFKRKTLNSHESKA